MLNFPQEKRLFTSVTRKTPSGHVKMGAFRWRKMNLKQMIKWWIACFDGTVISSECAKVSGCSSNVVAVCGNRSLCSYFPAIKVLQERIG